MIISQPQNTDGVKPPPTYNMILDSSANAAVYVDTGSYNDYKIDLDWDEWDFYDLSGVFAGNVMFSAI